MEEENNYLTLSLDDRLTHKVVQTNGRLGPTHPGLL